MRNCDNCNNKLVLQCNRIKFPECFNMDFYNRWRYEYWVQIPKKKSKPHNIFQGVK